MILKKEECESSFIINDNLNEVREKSVFIRGMGFLDAILGDFGGF